MSQKLKASLVLVTFVLSVAAGYWYGAKSVKPEVQVVEKVVEKVVERKLETARAQTLTTWKPDGTVVQSTATEVKTQTETKTDRQKQKTVTVSAPSQKPYKAGLVAYKFPGDLRPTYEAFVARRVVGSLWVSVHLLPTRGAVGVGLSVEF